jgi:phosphoglycolate phosphatase-like HAD superfamily hydrolase
MFAVIFDMDGTLVDSADLAVEAAWKGLRDYYRDQGMPVVLPSRKQVVSLLGLPSLEYFAGLLPEGRSADAVLLRNLVGRWEDALLEQGEGRMFPGTEEVFAMIRERGWKMALVSNCGRDYFDPCLEHLGLGKRFEVARCLDDGPTKTANVAEVLRVLEATHGVMVGDRRGDIEAGRANGLKTVAVLQGYGAAGELSVADARVANLAELPAVLDRLAESAMPDPD